MSIENERINYILKEIAKGSIGLYSPEDINIQNELKQILGLNKKKPLQYIGLIGHIGAGKDHIANYLAQTLERKVKVVKFATKLTEIVALFLGVTDLSLFQGREWKDRKQFYWQGEIVSSREVQKSVATIIRDIDPDFWLNCLVRDCKDPDTLYIVSDLRFPNEMQFIQQNNGIVVFIENQQAVDRQFEKEVKDGVHQPHTSEQLTWSIYQGKIRTQDYYLNNSNYDNPQPLQDLVNFLTDKI